MLPRAAVAEVVTPAVRFQAVVLVDGMAARVWQHDFGDQEAQIARSVYIASNLCVVLTSSC